MRHRTLWALAVLSLLVVGCAAGPPGAGRSTTVPVIELGPNEPELVPGAVLTITPAKTLRCEFGPSAATCLVPGDGFVHAPKVQGGRTPAAVSVDASGALTWIPDPGEDPFHLAEVAGGRFSILGYDRTYTAAGWTITPDTHGTTITNDRTNHGMFISVDNATVNSV